MNQKDILNIVEIIVGAGVFIYFFVKIYRHLLQANTKFKATTEAAKELPAEERSQLIKKARREMQEAYFSEKLYWKFFSSLFVVGFVAIPFTVFLLLLFIRGLRAPIIYLLLGCAVISLPFLIMSLITMGRLVIKKHKKG